MAMGTLTGWVSLGGLYLLLFVCERWVPLRQPTRALPRRLLINVCISALALATAMVIVEPAGESTLQHVSIRDIGLLNLDRASGSRSSSVTGFLLMDLTFYYWHRRQSSDRVPLALSQRAPHRP